MILTELTHSFSHTGELPFNNIKREKKKSMIDSLTGLVDSATKSPVCLISGRNPAFDRVF